MKAAAPSTRLYVIKAEDLVALNYLTRSYPAPQVVEWIDRATDRKLSPSRLEQLLRTYHRNDPSPSIARLRETAGLRAVFAKAADRNSFARAFAEACAKERFDRGRFVTAIFASIGEAEIAESRMIEQGIPEEAFAVLWRANKFMDSEFKPPKGHSRRRVFAGVSAGGMAAAALGIAVLIIPGVGPVAAAGAVIASAMSSVATASGIIGATGAAMATMLSDLDVDDFAANHLEDQLRRGKAFLSIDQTLCDQTGEKIGQAMETLGGRVI